MKINDFKKHMYYLNIIVAIIIALLFYVVLFSITKFLIDKLPEYYLWNDMSSRYKISYFGLTLFEVFFVVLNLPIYMYGVYFIVSSSIANHKGRDQESREPIKLIINGPYSKVRHPMYAGFILIQTGFWLSICSLYGIAILVVLVPIFVFNSYREEKNELIPKFGNEYRRYINKVGLRFFDKKIRVYLIFLMLITIVGIIKM